MILNNESYIFELQLRNAFLSERILPSIMHSWPLATRHVSMTPQNTNCHCRFTFFYINREFPPGD